MKKITLHFAIILLGITALPGCKKEGIKCPDNTAFCAYISSEEYDKTGSFVDHFLGGMNQNLSDLEKLERLRDWLIGKDCVENAEILCNACIETNPPQSELKIWFIVKGQQKEKILDILMDDPLRFRNYHD